MIELDIVLNGDGCWPELSDRDVAKGERVAMAALGAGMVSGAPSVTIRIDLPDGRVVLAATSLKLLLTAADAFRARYGDPR